MNSISDRFKKIREKNILFSDYICFCEVITNRRYTEKAISKNFNKLVDKYEYDRKDKKRILSHLQTLLKPLNESTF